MNIDLIMKLTTRRSELLAELKDVDAQIRVACEDKPKRIDSPSEPGPRAHVGFVHKRGEDRLPRETSARIVEWANAQQTPFSAYHVAKELGLAPRFERQLSVMLSLLFRDGKIERLTTGDRTAQAVYKRKATLAAVSNG